MRPGAVRPRTRMLYGTVQYMDPAGRVGFQVPVHPYEYSIVLVQYDTVQCRP